MYDVEKVPQLLKCAEWAKTTAIKKKDYTMDLWYNKRPPFDIFMDLFYGDLAKNIVKKFIEINSTTINLSEYDLERNDSFKDHDKYDLNAFGKTIEIKSSLEKYNNNPENLFNNRRIIVNVKHQQTISDFVVQVLFVPRDLNYYKTFELSSLPKERLTEETLLKACDKEIQFLMSNEVKIYVCGWINRLQEENILKRAIRGEEAFRVLKRGNKAFRKIYGEILIKDSNEMDKLIKELESLKKY